MTHWIILTLLLLFPIFSAFFFSITDSVSLIVQFALMEARNNNFEQAKAMMDPILVSYPQRIDIWCTYCDMLVKANQISEARSVLVFF